jgi:hypothetical protein
MNDGASEKTAAACDKNFHSSPPSSKHGEFPTSDLEVMGGSRGMPEQKKIGC